MKPEITIVGGGMITHDQLLPSLYHMQRQGLVGEITVCASRSRTLRQLAASPTLQRAFPGQSFRARPSLDVDPDASHPELYREVIASMPPRNLVVVAVPDPLHYEVILTALRHEQHVCAVKPLVLKAAQALEIEQEAYSRGLLVGIEYHKRFDDRSLLARRRYREGKFGEFRLGTACLLEKWYYRHSNFQNWCTVENSDAFTYIGCHYVDLVHFITGLLPVAVSVYGIRDRYPNGNEGFLWTDARVIWSNGACLNVQNALGFPDEGPGTNTQGLTLYCAANDRGGLIAHSDQYRGIKYCYVEKDNSPGATYYAEPSTDYFQYVDMGGPGLVPVGYGYRSVEYIVKAAIRLEDESAGLPEDRALERRQALLKEYDHAGIMATPANSYYNELVIEAGRLSLLNGGREAVIEYGDSPRVRLR
ncbi:MAG: Gfo/Idh/MocA family oxidoreductase [Bryobacterales bacterium]|nr:Gfo/Idh/MocA family oxidoreductase [Bryobacteraceae bacterium]MDW8354503.1 Gfo/Idh/MocA family oxidoreductase [Bryobacterales bacterium]